MRRFISILAVALLVGATLTATAYAQYGKEYQKPVRVYSGADSVYNAAEPDSSTGTGALYAKPTIYIAARGTAYSNWIDISELAVPDFIESYRDSQNVATTVTRTETRAGTTVAYRDTVITTYRSYGSGAPDSTYIVAADSLIGHPQVTNSETVTWTESWSMLQGQEAIGFMLSLAASGDLDSVYVSAHVSMDGVGYKVIQRTLLDPSEGTTIAALAAGYEVMEIPAGKLKGWNKVRFQFNNYDRSHDDPVTLTAYHNYALQQPIPDWDEVR